ncbi:hypothetical protein [Celeribacter indicus]|uniref:Uncharacterized protein n=1 Tax=Celeribacter indicus TaxID=1208324 RepID=A0A0B5E1M8_9RHOB|nr:hypothetical protein [Celeribacter indicus]AJE47310.1 hypothetical protein P73_2595 [Celeribacter indicus]SDW03116.1 hypothetical protein SAMN05443573_101150 [Celeribacter indicus]
MFSLHTLGAQLGGVAQLCLRGVLAITLLQHPAVQTLDLFRSLEATATVSDAPPLPWPHLIMLQDLGPLTLSLLLVMIALWIGMGMRTRVMALLAVLLTLASHFVSAPMPLALNGDLMLPLVVTLLALPLIAFGGGRFSFWRGGWRDLV